MKKILPFLFLFSVATAFGQNKNKSSTPAVTKIPKVMVTLGGVKGGDIALDILSRIIDSALVVSDEKGNSYLITRFRSIYKFKSSYEDPESGERKKTDDMRVNEFKNTNLMSQLWRQSIKDNIVKDDVMILDDIIVRLKNGSKIMAPSLTFKVTQ